jgi:hypothetical protein
MLAPRRIFASGGDPASSFVSYSNNMYEELNGATVMRPATGINLYVGLQRHPANSAANGPLSMDIAMAPNGMQLRRLSRVEVPPHFCAPETSPLQPLAVCSHTWSDGLGFGPPQDVCELILLAPLDASLIQRSDPKCPHSHDAAD